jgi:uncharacterized protein (TIGR02594 family)
MSEPKWLAEAVSNLGVKEINGKSDNPVVMQFYKDCGHPEIEHDETAWCAAFVGACLKRSGKPVARPVDLNLMARSYLKYGTPCKAKAGAIFVMARGRPPSGHVGFVLEVHPDGRMTTLEGNVSNQVKKVIRPQSDALGFRWPPEAKEPTIEPPKVTVKDVVQAASQSQTVRMQIAAPFVLLAGYISDGGQWLMDFTMGLVAQLPGLGNDIEGALGTAQQFSTWLDLPFAKISLGIVFAFSAFTIYRHVRDKLHWGQT